MQLIKKFVILFYGLILSSNVSADYIYNSESLEYTHSDYECAKISKKEYLHYEYTFEKSENLTCFFKKKVDGTILTKQLNNYSVVNDLLENKNSIDLNVLTYYDNGKNKDLEYVISVTEFPKVELKSIENIKINEYNVKIDSKETDLRIKEIAKNQNNFVPKKNEEIAAKGDLLFLTTKQQLMEKISKEVKEVILKLFWVKIYSLKILINN